MTKTLITFISFFLLLTACKKEPYTMAEDGGIIVNCQIITKDGENIDSIKTILTQRLTYIDPSIIPVFEYNESDNTYEIQLPGVIDDDIKLLFSHGSIEIKEVYKRADLEIPQGYNAQFDAFGFEYGYFLLPKQYPTIMTMVSEDDIRNVENVFDEDSIKLLLPRDMRMMWSKPVDNNPGSFIKKNEPKTSDLYMVKDRNDDLDINETFKSSKVQESPYGNYEISINLNEEGAKKFENMTEKNIGNQLAFILDKMVLMAPTVNSKIEGGRMSIMGNFSEKEMIIINSLLHSSIIKSEIEILDIKIVDGQAQ